MGSEITSGGILAFVNEKDNFEKQRALVTAFLLQTLNIKFRATSYCMIASDDIYGTQLPCSSASK
jgi:hypothetical protein